MGKIILLVAASIALAGAALAKVETSASTYFLDIDPGRYGGPGGQRIAVLLGDQPRHVALNAQDEICVQLLRAAGDGNAFSAHVRALRPEPHDAAMVRVAGPDVTPGTYRSTPWGMLLRLVPEQSLANDPVKPVGTIDAPVCSMSERPT